MKPLFCVVGTTGVGKSSMAVKLAQALSGHIINGDSMQVYKGLDIITNKPDAQERATAPHHLFDFVDPSKEYSVAEYLKDALSVITNLHKEGQIPIVVGGTNYYIQSLLWNSKIIETADAPGLSNKAKIKDSCHPTLDPETADTICFLLENTDPRTNKPDDITQFAKTAPFHETLCTVDPVMGKRWHPRDIRKIRRSLEIFYTTGKKHSHHIEAQKKDQAGSKLRFPTCVFWLYGEPEELYPRLDERVDLMIQKGMFDEMKEMRDKMKAKKVVGLDSQYTRGVLQSIGDYNLIQGFKEFDAYLNSLDMGVNSKDLLDTGVEEMKRGTRQYARRQVTWIKNKLAPECLIEHESGTGAFYLIDATSATAVTDELVAKVVALAKDFLLQNENSSPSFLGPEVSSLLEQPVQGDEWKQYVCRECVSPDGKPKLLNGSAEFEIHMNSSTHKKSVKRNKNAEKYMEWKEKNKV
ncbi:hypothetical protein HDV01_004912 [Terramyces sp. JEL0728]|nr:hypothetical protein HDV01_004912 [Terramyces sp. JEL0728]